VKERKQSGPVRIHDISLGL